MELRGIAQQGGRSLCQRVVASLGVLVLAAVGAGGGEGEATEWHGYRRVDLEVDGRSARVVEPRQPAPGRPWVWRARFPDFHPEADVLLLDQGFHVAYVNTDGMLGSPDALRHWDRFYQEMTGKRGLAGKPALEAVSRGGLFAYRWAAQHPDKVACIYADTPVCDFKSWPLGQGVGLGHPATWNRLLDAYGLTEDEALAFRGNPVDVLAPIAAAGLPLMHIVSLNDRVVPPVENTFLLANRYRALGGTIEILEVQEGTEASSGHHFRHPDPERVAAFIRTHALPPSGSE